MTSRFSYPLRLMLTPSSSRIVVFAVPIASKNHRVTDWVTWTVFRPYAVDVRGSTLIARLARGWTIPYRVAFNWKAAYPFDSGRGTNDFDAERLVENRLRPLAVTATPVQPDGTLADQYTVAV